MSTRRNVLKLAKVGQQCRPIALQQLLAAFANRGRTDASVNAGSKMHRLAGVKMHQAR
jgi:hypothetical protein